MGLRLIPPQKKNKKKNKKEKGKKGKRHTLFIYLGNGNGMMIRLWLEYNKRGKN